MSLRIPWNQTEALILLNAFIQVSAEKLTRKDAISLVSKTLRERSAQNGILIDDTFRNENGIALQMSVMEYIFTDGAKGLKKATTPKLFIQTVALFKEDPSTYEKMLEEAKNMSLQPTDVQNDYFSWLATQISPAQLSDLYCVYAVIEEFCLSRKILRAPLFQTVDLSILAQIRNTVESNRVFRFTHKRQLSKMSSAIRFYIQYVKEFAAEFPVVDNNLPEVKQSIQSGGNTPTSQILDLISQSNIEFVDKRDKGGCLWIIGGKELQPFVDRCKGFDVVFHYKEDGGNATNGHCAWWTTGKTEKDKQAPSANESILIENSEVYKTSKDTTSEDAGTILVDLSEERNYAYTRPISLSYFGTEIVVTTWKAVYIESCKLLFEDYPEIFENLKGGSVDGHGRVDVANCQGASAMAAPGQVSDDLFLETNLSATDLMHRLRHVIELCNMDYDNLKIRYSTKSAVTTPASTVIDTVDLEKPAVQQANSPSNQREAFGAWMEDKQLANPTRRSYSSALSEVGRFAVQYGLAENGMYELTDCNEVEEFMNKLLSNNDFAEKNSRQHNRFRAAMRKYCEFVSESDLATTPPITPTIVQGRQTADPKWFKVLQEAFPDGYMLDDFISQFQAAGKWTELYGGECQLQGPDLDAAISACGLIKDGRVFAKKENEEDTVVQICTEIAEILDTYSCVYVEMVYNRYQKRLANISVYTEEVLSQMLVKQANGVFRKNNNYFLKPGTNAWVAQDCKKVLRDFGGAMSVNDISGKLWFIPYDTVYHALAYEDDCINTGRGVWMLAEHFPLSKENAYDVASVLNHELSIRDYVRAVDLVALLQEHLPFIADNLSALDQNAIFNILRYYLSDEFSFTKAIIAPLGQQTDIRTLFREFAANQEEFTLSALDAFAAEQKVPIYWEDTFANAVRVSETDFISKDSVSFDVAATDIVLDSFCPGDYLALNKVPSSMMMHLPVCGHPWNTYLLLSYIYGYSKKFAMLYNSIAKTGCYGAMVRRSANIKNYGELVERVLTDSDGWDTRDDALCMLVDNGYQAIRRFNGIDDIMERAKFNKIEKQQEIEHASI